MLRQRLRTRRSPLPLVGRTLLVLVALTLVWYGLMLLGLALKFSPGDIDGISGYRSIYDSLAALEQEDITEDARLIVAVAGLFACLIFGLLALRELPRPYLARGEMALLEDERGAVTVEPRAVERVAEGAAGGHPSVSGVSGRLGDDELTVNVHVRRPADLAETLSDVRESVREALKLHELPAMPVHVTLTGFEGPQRRELN